MLTDFDIDESTAGANISAFIAKLKEAGLLE